MSFTIFFSHAFTSKNPDQIWTFDRMFSHYADQGPRRSQTMTPKSRPQKFLPNGVRECSLRRKNLPPKPTASSNTTQNSTVGQTVPCLTQTRLSWSQLLRKIRPPIRRKPARSRLQDDPRCQTIKRACFTKQESIAQRLTWTESGEEKGNGVYPM